MEKSERGRVSSRRGLPQTVPCPYCKAAVGESCKTWGRRAHYSHEGRKREANRG